LIAPFANMDPRVRGDDGGTSGTPLLLQSRFASAACAAASRAIGTRYGEAET